MVITPLYRNCSRADLCRDKSILHRRFCKKIGESIDLRKPVSHIDHETQEWNSPSSTFMEYGSDPSFAESSVNLQSTRSASYQCLNRKDSRPSGETRPCQLP